MTKDHRETEVVRDPETGRVTGYVEHVEDRPRKKSGGGLLMGLILGAVLVAGGIAIYANNEGGFQQAGIEADQAASTAAAESSQAADQAGTAIGQTAENLGDQAEQAGDNIQRSTQ